MLAYYLDIFVPLYESSSDMVDISNLVEQGKHCTPVQLPYSDKNISLKLVFSLRKILSVINKIIKKFGLRDSNEHLHVISANTDVPQKSH